jgi:hypothetical protein
MLTHTSLVCFTEFSEIWSAQCTGVRDMGHRCVLLKGDLESGETKKLKTEGLVQGVLLCGLSLTDLLT